MHECNSHSKKKKGGQKAQNIKKNQNNVKQNGTQTIENVKESNEELTPTFPQLATPKMISQQQHLISTSSSFGARYTDDDKSRFESMRSKNYELIDDFVDENVPAQNDSLININVTQRRRNKKKRFKLFELPQLFSTETAFLNVIRSTITRLRSSADLNFANIIEDKRIRRFNPKYAETA